jgi:hypothetical protein
LIHGRSAGAAVGGGLLIAGGLATGGVAQASPGVHVEVYSKSGAAAAANAGTHNFGKGSTKETLADAMTYLNNHVGGTITFASSLSGDTIHLDAALPELTSSTTITGLGASKLAVDGGRSYRTFNALDNNALTISRLTVEYSNSCGAYSAFGDITVTDSVMKRNRWNGVCVGDRNDGVPQVTLSGDTIKDNGEDGVYLLGNEGLTMSHSLVIGNEGGVGANGGAIRISDSSVVNNGITGNGYGGVQQYNNAAGHGSLTVINSTISGNKDFRSSSADVVGGGIAVVSEVNLTLIGDTITDNELDNTGSGDAFGGGIGTDAFGTAPAPATLTLEDSVVAGNTVVAASGAADARYPDVALGEDVTSWVQDSLIGVAKTAADTFRSLDFISADQEGTAADPLNPKLGSLGPEGSKTATAGGRLWVQEPEKGSRLIGKGAAKPFSTSADPFKTDELGTKRPSKGVTIGAYQVPPKKKKHKH